MKRKLLNLACRHHILELVSGSVIKLKFPNITGINCKLFDDFKKQFAKKIEVSNITPGTCYSSVRELFKDDLQISIKMILNLLDRPSLRADYEELLLLCLLFVGQMEHNGKQIVTKKPGPYSSARWMSRLIYIFKITLYSDQYDLNKRYLELYPQEQADHNMEASASKSTSVKTAAVGNLQSKQVKKKKNRKKNAAINVDDLFQNFIDICTWVIKVYIKPWYTCTNSLTAASNDLTFLKQLSAYRYVDEAIAETTVNKFSRHLWYLSELLVPIAMFDPNIDCDTKEAMKAHMLVDSEFGYKHLNRFQLKDLSHSYIQLLKLSDFVNKNSVEFFNILGFDYKIIETLDASEWMADPEFIRILGKVSQLRVVNDIAEQCIRQVQIKRRDSTKSVKQFSLMHTVIYDYIKSRPSCYKSSYLPNTEKANETEDKPENNNDLMTNDEF